MISRKAILAKIKALLSKTVGNGCTEAEAMAALAKAQEMMAEHAVNDADMAFGGEECTSEARVSADRDRIRVMDTFRDGPFSDGYYAGLVGDAANPHSIFAPFSRINWSLGNDIGGHVHRATVEAVVLHFPQD